MFPYQPLATGSVRLLRLLPHQDENSRIECQLITFSLLDRGSSHPYEALSYVWGSEDIKQPIYIGCNNELGVTANLHAALRQLRHCFVERLLWIDAICINQNDKDEKGQQVQTMAKIYAKASRVIVWLVDPPDKRDPANNGDRADNGGQALEAIRAAAEQRRVDPLIDKRMILTLLARKWFQRIWVLQEVAAARHILIKYGSTEIDGYAFCSGLSVLKPFEKTHPDLQALIPPIAHLIRGAVFRRRHDRDDTSRPARFSLNIRPLGELVDMYHIRKAKLPLDKVYALLGMSNDDPYAAGFEANYESSWKDVFQKLIHFCLSNQISVSTWDDVEVAVIEAKGCVLGKVSSAGDDTTPDGEQRVEITWKTAPSSSDATRKQGFDFQTSAKAIKEGDVVCLLQGASSPTIIRPHNGFLKIIMITVPETNDLPRWSASITNFPNDLLLVWDWDGSRRNSQGGEDYNGFISKRGVPRCPMTACQCQGYLDRANSLWDLGLLLNSAERYGEAVENLRKAIEVYGTGAALRSVDNTYPSHCPREAHEEAMRIMDDLLKEGAIVGAKYKEHGQIPLSWAAEDGHEAMARMLLVTGAALNVKDIKGRTPLSRAAQNGHAAVVQLLLTTRKVDADSKDNNGRTPLTWAAQNGHEAVVQSLLATGAALNVKDDEGRTPLSRAAENGRETVVQLLLVTGAALNVKDDKGRTPLSWAAQNGHEAVVKLLLATGKVDADSWDNFGRRPLTLPLTLAAQNGHEAVVQLLLATGKADADLKGVYGRTPLTLAAASGHEAVVQLLLATRKIDADLKDNYGRTPLTLAAESGHGAVVQLLLATWKVDADLKGMYGRTPLSWAAASGHETVVQLLLATGKVDTDSKDNFGQTPLTLAAASGHGAVVQLLLATGKVDADSEDNDGRTPLTLAAASGHEAVVQLLLATGKVDADSEDNYGQTPLSCAAGNGHEAVVQLLLRTGKVNVDSKSNSGGTPLSWAAAKGSSAVVELLLATGKVDTDSEDNYGRTPLSRAAQNGHEAVVELLQSHGAQLSQ